MDVNSAGSLSFCSYPSWSTSGLSLFSGKHFLWLAFPIICHHSPESSRHYCACQVLPNQLANGNSASTCQLSIKHFLVNLAMSYKLRRSPCAPLPCLLACRPMLLQHVFGMFSTGGRLPRLAVLFSLRSLHQLYWQLQGPNLCNLLACRMMGAICRNLVIANAVGLMMMLVILLVSSHSMMAMFLTYLSGCCDSLALCELDWYCNLRPIWSVFLVLGLHQDTSHSSS